MSNSQPNIPRRYARSTKSITKSKSNNPPPTIIIPRVSLEQHLLPPNYTDTDLQNAILEIHRWAELIRLNDGGVMESIKHLFTPDEVKGYIVKPGAPDRVDHVYNLDGTTRILNITGPNIYDPPLPPDARNEAGDPIKNKYHLYIFDVHSETVFHFPTDPTAPNQEPIPVQTITPSNKPRLDCRYGALVALGLWIPYNYISLLEAQDKVNEYLSHIAVLEKDSSATRQDIENYKAKAPEPLIFPCEGIKTAQAMAALIETPLFQRAIHYLASEEYHYYFYLFHNPPQGISSASILQEYNSLCQRSNTPFAPIEEYRVPLCLKPAVYLPVAIGYYGGNGPKGAGGMNYELRPFSTADKHGLIVPDVTDCYYSYDRTTIIIMPDKDLAGKEEAKLTYNLLNSIPSNKLILKFVPPSVLPNAWDVAEPLPPTLTYKDLLSKIFSAEPFSQNWIEMPNPKNKKETITNFRHLDNLHRGLSKYVSSAVMDFAYGNKRILKDPQGRNIPLSPSQPLFTQCMYAVNDIMEVPREADFEDELSYKKALQTYPCEQVDSIYTYEMDRVGTGRKYTFTTPPSTTSRHTSLLSHTLPSGHPTFHPSRLVYHAFNVPPPPLPPKDHPANDDPTIPYSVTEFPPPPSNASKEERLGYMYGLLSELIIRNHVETTIGRAPPSITKLNPIKPKPAFSIVLPGASEAGKSTFVALMAGVEPGKAYDINSDRFTDKVKVHHLVSASDRYYLALVTLVRGKVAVEIAEATGGKEITTEEEGAMKTATELTQLEYRDLGSTREDDQWYTIRYTLFYTTNNNEFITANMTTRRWMIIDPADAQYSMGEATFNNIKQYRSHIKRRVNNPEDPLTLDQLSPDDQAIYRDEFPGLERLHHQHGLSVMLAYMHDHLQHLWLTDYFSFRDLSYMMEEKVNGKMHTANWTATLYDYLDRSNPSVDGLTPVMHPSVAIKSEELFAMVKDLGFSQTVTKKALIAALEDWGYVEHVAKIPGDKSSKAYRFWAIQEGAEHGKKAGHIEHSGKAVLYCANYISTLGGVRGHIIYSQFGFDNKQIHQPPSKPSTAYTQEELLLHDEYQQPVKEGK